MLAALISILTFLAMNAIISICAVLLSCRLLRFKGLLDTSICSLILYLSQIILTEMLLGIFGVLYLKNVIALNLLILLVIWALARNKTPNFSLDKLGLAIGQFPVNGVIFFVLTVLTVFGTVKVLINLVNPPFGWDSLNYHFTFAVEWLKNGNLNIPITVFDDPSPSYYPINGSLYYLWLMIPLKNVFFADLGQVPFFILAILSVYSISRKLGLRREYSFFAASLFMLIPNFFKQLQIAYVDIMVTGLFLASLNYLFLIAESFSLQNILLFSASLGLLVGTKTIGLPYGLLLFLPFIYLTFKNLKKSYLFIASILAILFLGGFSYFRNFLVAQNPLYPLHFSLFGKNIFKGVMDTATYSARFKPSDYSLSKMLFHEGLGLQTILLVLPAIFLTLPVALRKERQKINFFMAYFFILPLLIYFIYRFVLPLVNLRYLYAMLALGIVMGFYTLDVLGVRKFWVNVLVVICVLASVSELAKRQELVTSIILTAAIIIVVKLNPSLLKARRIVLSKGICALVFILKIGLLAMLLAWYNKNEFPQYIRMVKYSGFWPDATKAWNWLNDNSSGNNIAYAGRPVPFPLYGRSLKNNVYYVSVNKVDPAKLHYFKDSFYRWDDDAASLHKCFEEKGNYRSQADYGVWLNNLKKRKIDYLFVYSLHQTREIDFPMEDRWAMANPGVFKPVLTNSTIHIYRIIK